MSGLTCTGLCVLHELDHLSGVRVSSAVFHAVNPFFAAFDTGGFSPRSTSVGYYHSAPVEAVLIVLMIAGALSFALHHRLWQGDGRELLRNIETRVLAITFTTFFAMLVVGLVGNGVYRDGVTAFRRVPVGQRTHGGGVLLHPWCGLLDRVGVLNTRRRRTRA